MLFVYKYRLTFLYKRPHSFFLILRGEKDAEQRCLISKTTLLSHS